MKVFFLLLSLLVSSVSFASGTVDGGGGGTTPAHPGEIKDVIRAIHSAKENLRLYFRYRQHEIFWSSAHFGNVQTADRRFFEGPQNLLTILEQVQIEVPTDRPCYDANHVEVDGSMYASSPQMICISAFRIASKVDKLRVEIEVLGLIAHELSHHIGANEDEAVMIQKLVVDTFAKSGTDGAYQYVWDAWFGFSNYDMDMDALQQKPPMETNQLVYVIEKLIADFTVKVGSGPFYLFAKTDSDEYEMLLARLKFSLWFTKGQSSLPDAGMWRNEYERVFNGKDSVKFSETSSAGPNTEFANEEIKRLTSMYEVKYEFYRAKSFAFNAYSRYTGPFNWMSPLLPLKYPIGEAPWTPFLGSYRVVDTQCSAQGINPVTIKEVKRFIVEEIIPGFKDATNLKAETEEGISNYRLDSGIGTDDQSIGTVTVSGHQTSAQRQLEKGTGWESQWIKSLHELKKKDSELIMIRTIFRQDWSSDIPTQSKATCTYKLVKE
jgi:hypothetical protein